MNDITKARHFLRQRGSDLQGLQSFALMLSSVEKKYRDIKMRQAGNRDVPGTWEEVEVETALDYSVLRYLKRHNQLPPDIGAMFKQDITIEQKRLLASRWANV